MKIDGKDVRNIFDLSQRLEARQIGDTVDVTVAAGGTSKVVQVVLAKE